MTAAPNRYTKMVEAAAWLAEQGFADISWAPLRDGKAPTRKWKSDATGDPALVRKMLTPSRNALVIPKGKAAVIDVDDPAVVAALEEAGMPAGFRVSSPTPGRAHFYVYQNGVELPPSFAGGEVRRAGSGMVLGPWSLRADGQYTSNAVHILPELPVAVAEVILARRTRRPPPRSGTAGCLACGWLAESVDGSRYDAIRNLTMRLHRMGHAPDVQWQHVRDHLAPRFADALPEVEVRERFDRATADVRGMDEKARAWQADHEETRETETPSHAAWPEPPADAAYHGLGGVLVNAVAPYTEADPVGLLGAFLTIFGTVAGNGWSLHQGDWQHANLFTVLVGDTSVSRKGTTFGVNREIYELANPDWRSVLVPGLGSGEGLIEYLKGHPEDPRALVFETEFSRFLTAMTRDGSTLSPVIRNAWDGVPIGRHVANVKHSGTVHDHHVGVLANITNVELAQRLTSVDAANGFGNRFLWLAVRRPHLLPFTEPIAGHVTPFIGSLRAALDFACGSGYLQLSPDARDRWEVFYRGRPARVGLIGALTGRAEPYVARLAMVYALLDRNRTIEVDHLEAAQALWDYAERSAEYVFGESTGDPDADALLRMLRDSSPLPWNETFRELGVYTAARRDGVVSLLERLGHIRLVKVRRAGRSRREIELVSDDG